jgi:hypothetical protein
MRWPVFYIHIFHDVAGIMVYPHWYGQAGSNAGFKQDMSDYDFDSKMGNLCLG